MKYYCQRCLRCGFSWENVIKNNNCPRCENDYLEITRIIETEEKKEE